MTKRNKTILIIGIVLIIIALILYFFRFFQGSQIPKPASDSFLANPDEVLIDNDLNPEIIDSTSQVINKSVTNGQLEKAQRETSAKAMAVSFLERF